MVNKLFVASTTRNKMPPKRRPGVIETVWSFLSTCWPRYYCPLCCPTWHLFWSHPEQSRFFIVPSIVVVSDAVWRTSTLFASIILVPEEHSITHYNQNGRSRKWPSMWLHLLDPPLWFYHKLKRLQEEKDPDLRRNCLRDKILRIQKFSDSKFPL